MRKKYGQNFLINPVIREKLLDTLELKAGEGVWEIGPGLGAMTKGLLARGARVTAFEIDPAFSGILRELFGEDAQFSLVEGDVLKTWPQTDREGARYLLGNLPYNIAATLLGSLIEKKRLFQRLIITVQREVAQRMTAKPGTKDYSSFTVLCSSVYKVTPLMVIKGASFYPVPRVDSQGLCLDLLPDQGPLSRLFYPLVRSLFASRRKTIQNNLSNFASSVIINEALERVGISGGRRAETLETGDFARLAHALEEILDRG
jgi:16S rRNA (adenine1518-N6/adenine1519-N6)-dimethyltransferase